MLFSCYTYNEEFNGYSNYFDTMKAVKELIWILSYLENTAQDNFLDYQWYIHVDLRTIKKNGLEPMLNALISEQQNH